MCHWNLVHIVSKGQLRVSFRGDQHMFLTLEKAFPYLQRVSVVHIQMWLKIFTGGDYFWLSRWAPNPITNCPREGGERGIWYTQKRCPCDLRGRDRNYNGHKSRNVNSHQILLEAGIRASRRSMDLPTLWC